MALTPSHNSRAYRLALTTSMGAILFGYDLAFIGTTIELEPFRKDFGLYHATDSAKDAFSANIVSLLQAGCFFGALASAPLSDKAGRRLTLAIADVLFIVGSVMQTASLGNQAVMFAGRFVGGLGVGAASMLVPLYTAECSPPAIRGRLVGIYEIGVQMGTCIGFWISFGVDRNMAPSTAQWMTPFAIQFVPAGLLLIGLCFLSESPRWLAKERGRDCALQTLSYLRGLSTEDPSIQDEMADILHQLHMEELNCPGSYLGQARELAIAGTRNRLLLGVAIMIFFQMAGSNAINYYSPRIFASIGLGGSETTLFSTGIYGIVRLVAVVIAMHWVVDRFGRTRMLICGSAVMSIAMWIIGALTKINGTQPNTTSSPSASSYASAVFIYIYAVGFCFSWAGVPWIVCAEIYPLRIRGLCVALCVATHWLFNFVIARSVPYMISNIHFGTYFVFASFITVSIPFVWFMVPETKGLKLEEMDDIFNGPPGMWGRRTVRRRVLVSGEEEEKEEKENGVVTEIEHV